MGIEYKRHSMINLSFYGTVLVREKLHPGRPERSETNADTPNLNNASLKNR